MPERSDHREPDTPGRQVIHIEVDGGYRPAVVRARPGSAIRLIFHRIDDEHCTERVMFSTPRLERRLAAYGSTSVDLPAQEAGEIRYTCGMGRYSGVIRLEEPSPSWSVALRRWVGHIGGMPVIVAAVGLFIVAALALVDIGMAAALLAGGLVLAALGGTGLWGMGKMGWRQPDAGRVQRPDKALRVTPGPSRSRSGR